MESVAVSKKVFSSSQISSSLEIRLSFGPIRLILLAFLPLSEKYDLMFFQNVFVSFTKDGSKLLKNFFFSFL